MLEKLLKPIHPSYKLRKTKLDSMASNYEEKKKARIRSIIMFPQRTEAGRHDHKTKSITWWYNISKGAKN